MEDYKMGLFNKKSPSEKLYEVDKAVRNFAKGKKNLSEKEHKQLHKLLKKRANAMSEAYGVKISPIFSSYKEAKKFREKNR